MRSRVFHTGFFCWWFVTAKFFNYNLQKNNWNIINFGAEWDTAGFCSTFGLNYLREIGQHFSSLVLVYLKSLIEASIIKNLILFSLAKNRN